MHSALERYSALKIKIPMIFFIKCNDWNFKQNKLKRNLIAGGHMKTYFSIYCYSFIHDTSKWLTKLTSIVSFVLGMFKNIKYIIRNLKKSILLVTVSQKRNGKQASLSTILGVQRIICILSAYLHQNKEFTSNKCGTATVQGHKVAYRS